jgi:hypothetical protein
MRIFLILSGLGASFGATALALTAHAEPPTTTQSCLGELDAFLACPPGSKRIHTECRAEETRPWSGSRREGPAVFLRDDHRVIFAANYQANQKQGRVFRFDPSGALESFSDMAGDDYHGISVDCFADGKVGSLGYFQHGKAVGLALHWKEDGTFAFAYDQTRRESVTLPVAQQQRPDHLCRPRTCDVHAAPDLSGLPK